MAEVPKSGNVAPLVTNIEVLTLLQAKLEEREIQDAAAEEEMEDGTMRRPRRPKKLLHRDWIEQKVYNYLLTTPATQTTLKQLPELVAQLKRQPVNDKEVLPDATPLEGYGLTDAESLQVINLMPSEPVELHLIVQDITSRLSEEQQNKLLETIGKYKEQTPQEEEEFTIDDE